MTRMISQVRFAFAAVAAVALVAAAPSRGTAQASTQVSTDDHFDWSGTVAPGAWVKVANLNGSIEVEHASGSKVEIHAEKRWRRSDPKSVRVQLQRYGANDANVVVCALWGDRSSCDENGYNGRGSHNNDVSVAFTIRVPDGVKVDVNTVNGGVSVTGATDEVEANTVNGSIEVETSGGPVNAETVNGSVRARMGKFPLTRRMSFESVNGSVIAEFSGDVNADVDLSTVNGHFNTDYPVTVSGKLDPKNLKAKLGNGGPLVKLSTVNGNVELRRHD